jgi:hypothetical protein
VEPNNNTEARWWVTVQSSHGIGPKFYAGFDNRHEALGMAERCNADEDTLFVTRARVHRKPARYNYTVTANPTLPEAV